MNIYSYDVVVLGSGAAGFAAAVNIAKAGFFSSDRTIAEYNRDIWKLK